MKKNWALYWGMLLAIVAIAMFAGAGISYFVYTGDLAQMIIPAGLLIMAGIALACLSCYCMYNAGKGGSITADKMRPDYVRLIHQDTARNGQAFATVETGDFERYNVSIPDPITGITPGMEDDFVRPTIVDGKWTLVLADYKEFDSETEKPEPARSSPPKAEKWARTKADEDAKKKAAAEAEEKKKAKERAQLQE